MSAHRSYRENIREAWRAELLKHPDEARWPMAIKAKPSRLIRLRRLLRCYRLAMGIGGSHA